MPCMQPKEQRALRARLLAWYGSHGRRLPWRRTRDPYRIWVSEIMLQQTRVGAVLGHYWRFLRRFPSLRRLAAARRDSVLAAWSGLGYYRRARALHASARLLVRERAGRFPRSSAEWRELPGVGRYTAAAIASIAFGEAVAVVDGNVERVLRRLLGRPRMRTAAIWSAAEELLSRRRPADFNQAMMELGATVCLPGAPRCGECPLAAWCRTRGRAGRTASVRRRRRRAAYTLACARDAIFLVRRPVDAALMPGMWELPGAEARPAQNPDDARVPGRQTLLRLRHSIMNTDYAVQVVGRQGAPPAPAGRWVARRRLGRLPLTGLARKILRRLAIIQ